MKSTWGFIKLMLYLPVFLFLVPFAVFSEWDFSKRQREFEDWYFGVYF